MKKVLNFVKGRKDDKGPSKMNPQISVEITNPSGQKIPSDDEHIIGLQQGFGYNVDVNGKDKSMLKIHRASWFGNLDKLKLYAKKTDINTPDSLSRTCLHLAVAQGHTEVAWYLLNNSASMTACDSDGLTPFLKAIECGQKDCTNLLIECGVDVNTADGDGNTGLHIASRSGFYNIASLLLKEGANLNVPNNSGNYPLHMATSCDHKDIVELLIKYGANVQVLDRERRTSLMLAARNGLNSIIKVLLENGAVLETADSNGWTAEDYAQFGGHQDLMELLETKKKEASFDQSDKLSVQSSDPSEHVAFEVPKTAVPGNGEAIDSPRSCIIPPALEPPRSWDLIQSGVMDQEGSLENRKSLLSLGNLKKGYETGSCELIVSPADNAPSSLSPSGDFPCDMRLSPEPLSLAPTPERRTRSPLERGHSFDMPSDNDSPLQGLSAEELNSMCKQPDGSYQLQNDANILEPNNDTKVNNIIMNGSVDLEKQATIIVNQGAFSEGNVNLYNEKNVSNGIDNPRPKSEEFVDGVVHNDGTYIMESSASYDDLEERSYGTNNQLTGVSSSLDNMDYDNGKSLSIEIIQSTGNLDDTLSITTTKNIFRECHSLELLEAEVGDTRSYKNKRHHRNKSITLSGQPQLWRSAGTLPKTHTFERGSIDAQLMCYDEALRQLAKVKKSTGAKDAQSNTSPELDLKIDKSSISLDNVQMKSVGSSPESFQGRCTEFRTPTDDELEYLDRDSNFPPPPIHFLENDDNELCQLDCDDKSLQIDVLPMPISMLTPIKETQIECDSLSIAEPFENEHSLSERSNIRSDGTPNHFNVEVIVNSKTPEASQSFDEAIVPETSETTLQLIDDVFIEDPTLAEPYDRYFVDLKALEMVPSAVDFSKIVFPADSPSPKKGLKNYSSKPSTMKATGVGGSKDTDNDIDEDDIDDEDGDSEEDDPPFWQSTEKGGFFIRQDTIVAKESESHFFTRPEIEAVPTTSFGKPAIRRSCGSPLQNSEAETASASDTPRLSPMGAKDPAHAHLCEASLANGLFQEKAAALMDNTERLKYELEDARQAEAVRVDTISILQSQLSRLEAQYAEAQEEVCTLKQKADCAELELKHLRELCACLSRDSNEKPISSMKQLVDQATASTPTEDDYRQIHMQIMIKHLEDSKKLEEEKNHQLVRHLEEVLTTNQNMISEKEALIAQNIADVRKLQEDTLCWKDRYEELAAKLELLDKRLDPRLIEAQDTIATLKRTIAILQQEKSHSRRTVHGIPVMARHHRRRQTACTSSSSVYGGRASNDDTCRSSVVDSLTSDLDSVTYNSSSEVAPRHSNPSRRTKHYRNKKSSLRTEPRMEEASNQWLIQWLSSEVVRLASSFLECGKKCIRYISHSGEWNDQRRSDSGLSSHIVESSGYRNRRKRQKNCVDSSVTFQRTNVKGKKKKKSQHDKFLVRPKQRLSHYGGSLTESAAFKGLTTLGYDEDCINDILRILKTVYGGPKEVNVYKATVNEADEVSIKDSDTSDDVPRTSVSPTDAEHDEKDVVVKIYNSSYPSVESQRIATSSTEIGEAGSGSTKPPDENNNKSDRRSDERNTSQSGKYTNQANDSRAKQHGVDHDSSKPRPSGGKLRHTALKRGSLISNICDRKRTIKVEEEEEEIIYPDADEGGIGVIHKIRHSESTVTKSSEPACEPYLVCDEKRIERLPTMKRLIRDQSRIRIDLEDLNDCDQRSNNHGNSSNTSNRRLSVLPHPGRGPHRYSNSPEQTTDLEKSTADQGPERLVASSTGRLTGVLMEDDQNHSRQRSKTKSVVMSNIRPVLSTTDDSSADEDKECSDYVGKRKSEQNSNKTSDDFIGKEKKTDVERSSRTRVQGTSSDGDNIKPIHSINDNEQPAQKQHNNSIGQSESASHQANLEILGISPSVSSKNEELSNITSPDITISGTRNTSSDAVRSSSYPDGEFQLSGEEKGVEEQVSGRVREGVVGTTAGLPANVIRSDTSGLNVHSGGRKLSPDIKPLVAKGSKRRNVESYNNPHQKLGSVEGQDPPSRSINEIETLAQSTEYSARRVSSSSRRLSGVSKHSLSVDQVKPKDMTSSDKSNDAQQKVRSGGSVDTAVGSVEKGLLSEGASFTESKNSKMLGDGSNTKRTHGGSTVHSRRTSRQNISVPRSADIVSVPSPTGGSAVPLKDNSSYNSGKLRSSNEMSSIYLTNMSKATLDPTNNELAANGNDGKHPITSQLGIGPVTKTNQAEHVPADDAKDEENTGPLIALVESQKFDSEASGKILPDIPNEPGDLNSAKSNEKGESSDPPPNSQLNLVPQENKSANNLKQELSKSSSAVRRLIGEFGTGHSIEGIVDRSSSLIDQNDKIMTEKGNESRSLVDENATAHSVDSDPKSGTTTEIPEVEKSANQNESHVKENLDVTMNMLPEKALDGNTEEVSSMLKNSASLDHNRASPIPATPTDDLVLESPYTSKSTNESLPSQPKVFAPKRSEIKLQGMDTGEKSSDKDSSAGKLEILKSNDEYRNKQEVSSDTKEKYVLPTSTYIGPPVDSKPTISGSTLSAEPPIISFPQPTLGSGEGSSQSIIKSPGAPSDPNLSQGVSAIAAAARDRFHAIQGSTPQPRKSINTPDDHVGVTFSKRRQSYMYVRMNSSATQDAPSGVQSENPKNVILQEGSKPNQVIEPVPTGAKREMSVCVLPTIKEVDDEEVHPYIRQRESPAEIRKSRRASRISKGPSLALRRRSSRSSSNPIITTLDSGEGDEAQGSDYVSHSTKQAGGPCNCRSICNCCTCGKNKEPKRSVPEKLEDPKDYSIETDGPFDYSTPPYPKDSMKVLSSPFFAHWTYYDVDQDHPLAKHLKRAEHTALDTECIIMKNYRLGDLCIPYLNITARKKISTKLVCNYYKKRSLLTKKRDAKAHADMSRCGSGGSPLQDDFRRGEGPCSCEEKRAAKHRGDSNIWEGYVDTEDDFVIPIELKKEVREEQYDNITSPDLPDSVFSCDLGGDCNCVQLPEYVREAQPLLLPTTPCESCECFVEEVASDPSVQSVFIQGSVTTAISFEDDSSKNTGIGEYVDNLEDLVIQLYGMIGKMKNVVEESNAGSTHEKHFGSKKESLL